MTRRLRAENMWKALPSRRELPPVCVGGGGRWGCHVGRSPQLFSILLLLLLPHSLLVCQSLG